MGQPRLAVIFLTCLFLPNAWAGQGVNPETTRLDLCLTVEEEDGSPSSAACGNLEVPNGTLTDDGDGNFSLTVVGTGRTLTGGIGIAAIGDLSADRTVTFDATEISSLTWGAGAFTTMTFDAGATDPVITSGSATLTITPGGSDLIVEDDLELQDATPHLRLTDTTTGATDFEVWADNDSFFLGDLENTRQFLYYVGNNNAVYIPSLVSCDTVDTGPEGKLRCGTDSGGGGGGNPGGSGSELQFRSDATTFGAVTSSSVSGAEVTFAGDVSIGGFAGAQLNISSTGGDQWGLHTENGPSGGSSWWGNATDSRHFWEADGAGRFYLPQNTGCTFLQTDSQGRVSCLSLDRTAGMFCGGVMSTSMACESARPRIPQTCTVQRVDVACPTVPTGAALIVDVNECTAPNTCTSIWDATQNNRVRCAATATSGSQTSFDDTTLATGNYLGIDVDQVGSTVAGSNVTVTITCRL